MAGTKTGITALQADFKIPGIPLDILHLALSRGHAAKGKIIKTMQKTISSGNASNTMKATTVAQEEG